jgi:alpha-1,2-mannosyltransferase
MSGSVLAGSLAPIRDAAWLTRERARGYATILLVMLALASVGWIAASHGGLDPLGKPLGTDFLSFWAASRLALGGQPSLAYQAAAHAAAEQSVFPGHRLGYAAFFYPPTYLLVCLPLALLPYLASLGAWLGATGWACWKVVRGVLGEAAGGQVVLLLAFPGVFANIGHGQNGLLTTALFGGAALCLERRPIAAGIMIGLLSVKPHLGLLAPFALILAGRWRTAWAAAATALAALALAGSVFGPETMRAFLDASALARATLAHGLVGAQKMASAYAAVRLLGGGEAAAWAAQALTAGAAALLLARVCRARPGGLAEGVALASASLLATPFLLDYDLMILAIPMAWLAREARRTGFLPWEKAILVAGFVAPLAVRAIAVLTGLPTGPFILLAVLWAVERRVETSLPRTAVPAPG